MEKDSNLYSVVIPVYNSELLIETTVARTVSFFQMHGLNYELILVNDASRDNSWMKLKILAKSYRGITVINFLKNYGQHSAIFCGIRHAKGDYVITMDDDLQNPPEEIIHLINKIKEGNDAVFARFKEKKHPFVRKMGTKIIGYINRKVFRKPANITLTNFRIISKEVVVRISNYKTLYPYIPGLILMFASNIANVYTEHHERKVGKSNYTIITILKLVSRLLFNYSSYPLRLLSTLGFIISFSSFAIGLFYVLRALFLGSNVPGFTTIVVILSFLNGFIIIMLGVMGEYISRMMNHMSNDMSYQIKETIKND
jgi:glycosyltransferase involved in cell wall biosynthesis